MKECHYACDCRETELTSMIGSLQKQVAELQGERDEAMSLFAQASRFVCPGEMDTPEALMKIVRDLRSDLERVTRERNIACELLGTDGYRLIQRTDRLREDFKRVGVNLAASQAQVKELTKENHGLRAALHKRNNTLKRVRSKKALSQSGPGERG